MNVLLMTVAFWCVTTSSLYVYHTFDSRYEYVYGVHHTHT